MAMNFKELLNERKADILKQWFDAVVATYAEETASVLKKKKAQFTNPVGYTLTEGLEQLFDALRKGMMPDTVSRYLDSIVRLRAIQDFAPSEAVSFIFMLKRIVRTTLGPELQKLNIATADLEAFESAVDDLALYAFDLYMKCREKIYELKANEARDMTFRLLQQARLIVDNQD